MALGACRTDVIRLILRQAGFVTICGLVGGIAGALHLSRAAEVRLFDVRLNVTMIAGSAALA